MRRGSTPDFPSSHARFTFYFLAGVSLSDRGDFPSLPRQKIRQLPKCLINAMREQAKSMDGSRVCATIRAVGYGMGPPRRPFSRQAYFGAFFSRAITVGRGNHCSAGKVHWSRQSTTHRGTFLVWHNNTPLLKVGPFSSGKRRDESTPPPLCPYNKRHEGVNR